MSNNAPVSKGARWTGYIMSALPVLLLLMSGVMKVMQTKQVMDGFTKMGIANLAVPIGVTELICTVIYLIPRTSVLGAILLTGYLGGAVMASLSMPGPGFLFPALVGVLVWGGLFMRDRSIRALIPLKCCHCNETI